jgi:hypothetical protein
MFFDHLRINLDFSYPFVTLFDFYSILNKTDSNKRRCLEMAQGLLCKRDLCSEMVQRSAGKIPQVQQRHDLVHHRQRELATSSRSNR